jgi:hypothetical protein
MSLFSHTFSHLLFSHGVAPSIKMHVSERCLRDSFFLQIFGLFFSSAVPKYILNHRIRRFSRDTIEDAFTPPELGLRPAEAQHLFHTTCPLARLSHAPLTLLPPRCPDLGGLTCMFSGDLPSSLLAQPALPRINAHHSARLREVVMRGAPRSLATAKTSPSVCVAEVRH